jgi:hypothetical protein
MVQGWIAARNATAKRREEQQEAAYVDAVTYVQSIQAQLDEFLEDPVFRDRRRIPPTPDEHAIRARMFLIAPAPVARAFNDLTLAWDALCWDLGETGLPRDEIQVKRDDDDVVRVRNALTRLKSSIRPKELGAVD